MKYFLVLLSMFTGCFSDNTTYNFSATQEAELTRVISEFRQKEFLGSIVISSQKIRNSSAEIVGASLPGSVYKTASRYNFTRIVSEPDFTYFVMNGFKGSNYGLLFTDVKEEDIKGFYDVKLIRPSTNEIIGKWYFVSSKVY